MRDQTRKLFNILCGRIAAGYGVADVSQQFSVSPSVHPTIECTGLRHSQLRFQPLESGKHIGNLYPNHCSSSHRTYRNTQCRNENGL